MASTPPPPPPQVRQTKHDDAYTTIMIGLRDIVQYSNIHWLIDGEDNTYKIIIADSGEKDGLVLHAHENLICKVAFNRMQCKITARNGEVQFYDINDPEKFDTDQMAVHVMRLVLRETLNRQENLKRSFVIRLQTFTIALLYFILIIGSVMLVTLFFSWMRT